MKLSSLYDLTPRQRMAAVRGLPVSREAQRALLDSGDFIMSSALLGSGFVQRDLVEEVVSGTLGDVTTREYVVLEYRDEALHLQLVGDESEEVLWMLAQHTPFASVTEALFSLDDATVRQDLARNAAIPLDQLKRLSLVQDEQVHAALTENESLPIGDDLDASWGALFLFCWYPRVAERFLGEVSFREALSLANSWHGSLESLMEAFALVSR